MAVEEWREVAGTNGQYEISNLGRLKKHYKSVTRISTGFLKDTGYYGMSVNSKEFSRHVLVCRAFHGEPGYDEQVRHLNGIRGDDRAENLAWGSRIENAQDCIRHGTNPRLNQTHCKRGHEFTPENTSLEPGRHERSSPRRRCRACARDKYHRTHVPKKRVYVRPTQCPQGHSYLDPENVSIVCGRLRCRTCCIIKSRLRHQKNRELRMAEVAA